MFFFRKYFINLGKPIVRIRRGRKDLKLHDEEEINDLKEEKNCINESSEDEVYEKIDADNHLNLIETRVDKKEFFERARCRFGKPDPLCANTHFRTHKEARILTRGDRDIIIKRISEEVIISTS